MRKFIYALCATMLMCGCSKEISYGSGDPIAFSIAGTSSRASSSVTDIEGLTDGEFVLVWQAGLTAATTTYYGIYEIGDSGSTLTFVSGTEFTIIPVGETYHAIYPYTEDMMTSDAGLCLTSAHLATDMMYASSQSELNVAGDMSQGGKVDFTFNHLTAKLNFTLVLGNDGTDKIVLPAPSTCKLYNIPVAINGFGAGDQEYVTATVANDGQDVIFDNETVASVYCYVNPEVTPNYPIIQVEGSVNNEPRYYTFRFESASPQVSVDAAKSYPVNVTVKGQ